MSFEDLSLKFNSYLGANATNFNGSSDNIANIFQTIIKQLDKNNDGTITQDELKSLKQIYSDSNELPQILAGGEVSQNVDATTLGNIMSFIETYITNSDSSSTQTSNLEGLDLDSFVKFLDPENENNIGKDFNNFLSGYDSKEIFNKLDSDGDGILSADELATISNNDGDNTNISTDDLSNILAQISTGDEKDSDNIKAKDSKSSKGSSGTSYYDDSSNPINNTDTQPQTNNDVTSAETAFKLAQDNYNSILSGNINDPNVQAKKESMDMAYNAWQTEMSKENPELMQNIDIANQKVNDVQNLLNQNEKEIFNNETELSKCENNYDIAKSYRIGLENKKSSLNSTLSSLNSSDPNEQNKISALRQQLSSIETEIATAKQTEERAKSEMEQAQMKLDEAKSQRTQLENNLTTAQNDLQTLMSDATLLAQNNPVLTQLKNDYENKKNDFETAYNEYKTNAKNNAKSELDNVNAQQTALSETEMQKKIDSYGSLIMNYDSNFADLLNQELITEDKRQKGIGNCGGAVREAMYRTVLQTYGKEAAEIFKKGYGVTGSDWDNQYLSDCPFYKDITDLYSSDEISKMLKNGELKGAIINYEAYKGNRSGHVEGVTTKGLTSDHTRSYDNFRSNSKLGSTKYHIYIPVNASPDEIEKYIKSMNNKKMTYDSPIL